MNSCTPKYLSLLMSSLVATSGCKLQSTSQKDADVKAISTGSLTLGIVKKMDLDNKSVVGYQFRLCQAQDSYTPEQLNDPQICVQPFLDQEGRVLTLKAESIKDTAETRALLQSQFDKMQEVQNDTARAEKARVEGFKTVQNFAAGGGALLVAGGTRLLMNPASAAFAGDAGIVLVVFGFGSLGFAALVPLTYRDDTKSTKVVADNFLAGTRAIMDNTKAIYSGFDDNQRNSKIKMNALLIALANSYHAKVNANSIPTFGKISDYKTDMSASNIKCIFSNSTQDKYDLSTIWITKAEAADVVFVQYYVLGVKGGTSVPYPIEMNKISGATLKHILSKQPLTGDEAVKLMGSVKESADSTGPKNWKLSSCEQSE